MKRILPIFFLIFFCPKVNAQFNLIVNEFSQGNGGTKEFIELLVVGTRTCTDSTADVRNWVFDDQNGWYGGAGNGIAGGHYRFLNDANWQKVPYGSIILIYNNGDQNGSISPGVSDPTDGNHDYVYILPINNSLIEQNSVAPSSPSSPTFVYPSSGYAPSGSWSSLGLANSGDAVIIADPANPGIAHFSILFGLPGGGAGFQTATVSVGEVAGNKNCYLSNNQFANASAWVIGNAGTAEETPGAGNNAANNAWIQSMRVQVTSVVPAATSIQPTCSAPTGTITVTNPVGASYTYSIDAINFQPGNMFTGLVPNTYTVTVLTSGTCPVTTQVVIDPIPGSPAAPNSSIIQPTCPVPTGTITITSPVGATYTYSIDGIDFQASPVFSGLTPNTYTITVQAGGCSTTGSAITIDPAPGSPAAPNSTAVQPTCLVPTGTITITSPVGATYTYSIDGINFQASPVFPGLTPNDYSITVQAGGCNTTGSAVTIDPAPGSPAAPNSTTVQPTCLVPTGTITITSPVGTTYTYSIDGINFQASPVFPGLTPNDYTITVQASSCSTAGPTITIDSAPGSPAAPDLTVVDPTCTILNGSITVTSPVGAAYIYSIDAVNFQSSPVFPGLIPNTYTITVQSGGCTSVATETISTVPGTPATPTTILDQPTCSLPTGTITITTPIGATYTYSIDGINFQASPLFPDLVPGSYTVTVQVAGGCHSSSIFIINTVPNAPAAPGTSSPVNYCQNATAVSLTATGTNLLWYMASSGGTGNINAPVPSTTVIGTTTYYVSQTVGGCESIRTPIDVIITNLSLNAITGNTSLCVHGSSNTILSNTTAGGIWNSSDPSVATVNSNGNVTAVSSGAATITYSVSSGGCSASVSTVVNIADFVLNLAATPNPVIQGNAVNLNTASGSSYDMIAWLPSPVFNNQTATSQTIIANNDAVYYAVGQSSSNGCIDTAQVSVTVTKLINDIFVPNVFTPNNDGKNDELRVYGNSIQSIEFRVFNQWGELIFETTDKNKGWDGKYKGVMQPLTVYVFALKAIMQDGSVLTKKGSVTLIR